MSARTGQVLTPTHAAPGIAPLVFTEEEVY
jgi:hypothetical protein